MNRYISYDLSYYFIKLNIPLKLWFCHYSRYGSYVFPPFENIILSPQLPYIKKLLISSPPIGLS